MPGLGLEPGIFSMEGECLYFLRYNLSSSTSPGVHFGLNYPHVAIQCVNQAVWLRFEWASSNILFTNLGLVFD